MDGPLLLALFFKAEAPYEVAEFTLWRYERLKEKNELKLWTL